MTLEYSYPECFIVNNMECSYCRLYISIQKSALETALETLEACWCKSLPRIGQPHRFLSRFDQTVIVLIDTDVIFVLTDTVAARVCVCEGSSRHTRVIKGGRSNTCSTYHRTAPPPEGIVSVCTLANCKGCLTPTDANAHLTIPVVHLDTREWMYIWDN